jgi:hypothetical protein
MKLQAHVLRATGLAALGLGLALGFYALILLGGQAAPASALPPRHTATPTAMPTATSSPVEAFTLRYGYIELQVFVPYTASIAPATPLWATVQWGDAAGQWHDVEGWQGPLQRVDSEPQPYSQVRWWVYARDYGKGPFRWAIYQAGTPASVRGAQLMVSGPFTLPLTGNDIVVVHAIAP